MIRKNRVGMEGQFFSTARGGVEPPDDGEIIVDSGDGWKQGGSTVGSQQSSDMFVPTGFAGQISDLTLETPNGDQGLGNSVELVFASGAHLRITKGSPATWECSISGNPNSWTACQTTGSKISSKFKVSTATTVGGQALTSGYKLKIS